jgi:hypothetical protein
MMESAEEIAAPIRRRAHSPEDWEWEAISDAVFQQFNFRWQNG